MSRNRRKTIEALQRLADRPGTVHEGRVARRMLDAMLAKIPAARPFRVEDFPRGSTVFYNYWAYPQNDEVTIVGKEPKMIQGKTWLRMRFTHLKQPRWVPVTSNKGCHISKTPLESQDAEELYYYWR